MNMRQILVVVTAAACGGSASTPRPQVAPQSQIGTYRFVERVAGGSSMATQGDVLEGTVTITSDSVIIDMSPGPCRYDERSATSTNISYRCADVFVGFDRSNPLLRSFYSVRVIERVPVRVCTRYGTNSQGQQVCLQYGTDYQERSATRSGTLRLQRQMN